MSLPGAARALGLGDIRIDSALNEPLSAQIDIVGATRDELISLTAKVANRDVFQRYGADRPAFLSSATFKVGLDAQGHPVLNVRSSEAFSDPLVSFLVDLRWGKNEVVREYSLLLDPAGYSPQRPATEVALASATASAPAYPTAPAAPAASASLSANYPSSTPNDPVAHDARHRAKQRYATTTHTPESDATSGHGRQVVAAGETLRGIARRAGARSESQIQQTMIAVFRANPSAFDGNINRMHQGAVLDLPSPDAVAAVSTADAKHEVRSHMTAWRLDGRPAASRRLASQAGVAPAAAATTGSAVNAPTLTSRAPSATPSPTATPAPTTAQKVATTSPSAASETPDAGDSSLKNRVQTLEQSLNDMHKQLATENAKIQEMREEAARTDIAPKPVLAAMASPQETSSKSLLGPVALSLALLVAGFAYARKRFARSTAPLKDSVTPESQDDTVKSETLKVATAVIAPPPATIGSAPSAAPVEKPKYVEPVQQRIEEIAPPPKLRSRPPTIESTADLEIDAEALERSYLDSLGIDGSTLEATGMGATGLDATGLETVAVDTSALDTAIIDMEHLNTMVIATNPLEDTNKLQVLSAPDHAINSTELDYNLLDLDATAQHVHMPSGLHDQTVMSERRTNFVDVLKAAIEQDPHRRDLRMKLLETYYSAAATNQRAFKEVVRKLSHERDYLSDDDWHKVMRMGREIAADDILFADDAASDDLQDCA